MTGSAAVRGDGVDVDCAGTHFRFTFPAPPNALAGQQHAAGGSGVVTAPMPGRIASVEVLPGAAVAERDLLLVLEAMKMEHRIEAPVAGTVLAVNVAPGAVVPAGATLVTIG